MNTYKKILVFVIMVISVVIAAYFELQNNRERAKNTLNYCSDLKRLELIGEVTKIKHSSGKGADATIWITCSYLCYDKDFPEFSRINDSIVTIETGEHFVQEKVDIGSKVMKQGGGFLFYFVSNKNQRDSIFLFANKFIPNESYCK